MEFSPMIRQGGGTNADAYDKFSDDIEGGGGSPQQENETKTMPFLNPKSLTSDNVYMFLRKTGDNANNSKDNTKSFKYEEQ